MLPIRKTHSSDTKRKITPFKISQKYLSTLYSHHMENGCSKSKCLLNRKMPPLTEASAVTAMSFPPLNTATAWCRGTAVDFWLPDLSQQRQHNFLPERENNILVAVFPLNLLGVTTEAESFSYMDLNTHTFRFFW